MKRIVMILLVLNIIVFGALGYFLNQKFAGSDYFANANKQKVDEINHSLEEISFEPENPNELLIGHWANYSLETGDMGLIFTFSEDNTIEFLVPGKTEGSELYADYQVDWNESPYNIKFTFSEDEQFQLKIKFIDNDSFAIIANLEDKETNDLILSMGIHELVSAERITDKNYQYALLRQKYPSKSDIRNALSEGIRNDDTEILAELISAGVDANTVLVNGYTLLAQAVWTDSPKAVSFLLENDADPYMEGEMETKSAHQMALANNHLIYLNLFDNDTEAQ